MTSIESTEPNLDTMKRADLPAIWGDFREKIAALKTTAETLTVTDESDKAGMKLARQTRLNLREIRIGVEARRKELGEEALRRKQGIDADAKAIRELIEPLEARLLDCEQFAERAEAARAAAKLAERTAAVIAANGEPASYNLTGCTEEAFAGIIAALEMAEKARIEAAAKAETERLAAIAAAEAERERIRLENIRLTEEAAKLRAESEAREKAAAAERKAAQEAADKARKETEVREAAAAKVAAAEIVKVQAEAEAARKKQAAIDAEKLRVANEAAAAERDKAAAYQAELKRQKDEQDAIEAEKANAAKKAAAAPDKAKLETFALSIAALKIPTIASAELTTLITEQVSKFAAWVRTQAEKL